MTSDKLKKAYADLKKAEKAFEAARKERDKLERLVYRLEQKQS